MRYALNMRAPSKAWLTVALLVGCGASTPQQTAPEPAERAPEQGLETTDAVAEPVVVAAASETDWQEAISGTTGDPGTETETGTETDTETGGDVIPEPPPGYGAMVPKVPAPTAEELTVHGLAGYEVVTIYSEPKLDSPKLGYLRIGTRMMVSEKHEDQGEGCRKGFYALPTGGFACVNKGLIADAEREPYMKYPPPKPALDQPHPYSYGYVRKWNSPMWWRIPTARELEEAQSQRAAREAERTGQPLVADTTGGDTDTDGDPGTTGGSEPEEPVSLPLSPGSPWLEKGFFLSLGEKVREDGHTYYRTARGAYVDHRDVYGYKSKDFQGVELGEEVNFPVGFVDKKTTKLIELTEEGKLKAVGKLERRAFVDLTEETEVNGRTYMMTADGLLVRKDDLVMPDLQPLPKGLEAWERWVDVSLSKQILVAYEGTRPVYVTLVSTGRKGTKEEPFETPTGRWRIKSKHISTTMDGGTASDGNYSIQDVPWTMFFHGNYALHGAFWHSSFGRVRSHGCVNLGPSDARWLFFWTTPFLPDDWHGVSSTDESPGSTVIVRE